MSEALFNAVCLAAAALAVTWFFHRRLASRSARREERLPAGTDLQAFLKAGYAAKAWFRAGVLLCSLAALGVYLGGGGRVIPLFLLCGAALCQYGAARRKTSVYLTQALQQQAFAAREPKAASQFTASTGMLPEEGLNHATIRR